MALHQAKETLLLELKLKNWQTHKPSIFIDKYSNKQRSKTRLCRMKQLVKIKVGLRELIIGQENKTQTWYTFREITQTKNYLTTTECSSKTYKLWNNYHTTSSIPNVNFSI